ncbi:hypothetical protein [Crystallibacter degradans]|uniref:hypothetical protein n=1 Tax=Crystallibacter degradans TaxID=2726743 RepID=UPI001475BF2C|nr:hypothetical protein [Arthrobacter sp. SF27]NMR28610.1 hypothetical protein [Arthrobacter sp. SF27]
MTAMGKVEFGRLTEAWKGEASDFTPLLAERLDEIGAAIGVDLVAIGKTEVPTIGGRRIDIVAECVDGTSFVIENQYGRADHDHLTRGLAYAVAPPRARGLVVIAEEHRDEFRAVAEYLNDLAELDPDKGIKVWLVEARAVRIGDSPWAPLFDTIVQPNTFTTSVGAVKRNADLAAADEFWSRFTDSSLRQVVEQIISRWKSLGHGVWYYRDGHATLTARAPVTGGSGQRSVVALYPDGHVGIPFSSYAGSNSGFAVPALTTDSFRNRANALFGFDGREQRAKTGPGWISEAGIDDLITFSTEVAEAYRAEVERMTADTGEQLVIPHGDG